ncbi:protein NRT1/ PTR FAMILY 5.10-like isoform X2 [Cornus florida]|uniref:protein NRT1/ PTR FAMILY 5.10-like isoform X2 n=1 Tax=Cornus florida TaxID=4283 RepID=UPI0028A09E7C|nr:protein NRT1/ PTR FAMILY 5.10-like isoform X2 [Cornus florida]
MGRSWSSYLRQRRTGLKHLLCDCIISLPRASFIFGMIFSRAFVEYSVINLLINYLTRWWARPNLSKATAVVNMQDGLSSIQGLVVLWLRDRKLTESRLFYVALLLIALGTAGLETPLFQYFVDEIKKSESKKRRRDEELRNMSRKTKIDEGGDMQEKKKMDEEDDMPEEKDVEAIVEVWWRMARFSGATLSTFTLSKYNYSWAYAFKVSAITMGIAYVLFCFGFFLFQWLDNKAAIAESGKQEKSKSEVSTLNKEKKVLLRMIPIWLTFLVYSLVGTTGTTFFIEQATNLNYEIGNGYNVSENIFFLFKSFSSFIFAHLCNLLIEKFRDRRTQHHFTLLRIGLGMVSCILCCITAMQVEIRRLHLVTEDGLEDNTVDTISMSIMWLTPQYCLLGVMEGLAGEGLQTIFKSQVADKKPEYRSYGQAFTDCVLGIGKFISIGCVFSFKIWFGGNVNRSRLDRYYKMLSFLCVGNLLFYICVSIWYYWNKVPAGKEEDSNSKEENGCLDSFVDACTQAFS